MMTVLRRYRSVADQAPIIFSLKKIVTLAARCVKLFLMATITRSDELRYANRARVLASLRASGSQSRKQLVENTELSAATITQVTAALLEERIIVESNPVSATPADSEILCNSTVPSINTGATATAAKAARGRPQVVLEMIGGAAMVAAVTINVDRIEVSLFDYSGALVTRVKSAIKHNSLGARALLSQVKRTLQRAIGRVPKQLASRLQHITVACQGKVSKHDGTLLWSPLSQSETIDFGRHLQARFGVNVSVDNDCNMIASALYGSGLPQAPTEPMNNSTAIAHGDFGNNERKGNFAAVLISYGIGLGLIHDGSILTGSRSSGTELGHMQIAADGPLCRCGNHGCIEAYAADYAIWRRVQGLPTDQLTDASIDRAAMQDIFSAAQQADGIERQALREAGTAIGHGLANLFAIFDSFPTRLVGLDPAVAVYVTDAINERLRHAGNLAAEDIVSVHDSDSENELIRQGAAMQCLSFVDSQIFPYSAAQMDA